MKNATGLRNQLQDKLPMAFFFSPTTGNVPVQVFCLSTIFGVVLKSFLKSLLKVDRLDFPAELLVMVYLINR
jgi:hypothetical protein